MTVLYSDRKGQRPSPVSRPWLVLVAFVLLAIALSWPVIAYLSSRLPGTATWAFDESTFVWNIWYFKHAVVDLHTSPLHSELIWFPLGIDLVLYTYNFFNALFALPLQVSLTLPVASNVTLLLATALSGFGVYLLVLYLFRASDGTQYGEQPSSAGASAATVRAAAFLAGVIYAFGSNRAVYAALGHYDMVTTQWLPFYVLYLVKVLRQPKLKNAAMAGLFFAFAALAEMIFASFLALLSLVLVLAYWPQLRSRRTVFLHLVLAAGAAVVLWLPALAPIAREFVNSDYALAGWGESIKLSADLAGWVTPTDLNPLLASGSPAAAASQTAGAVDQAPGAWEQALRAVEEGRGRFTDINTVFLGYVTLLLALLGAWRSGRLGRPWIWGAVVFGVLTLGPLLQINGRYRFSLDGLLPEGVVFPLPFALLHFIPVVNANRAPNRNSVILMMALAVLAAYGARWLLLKTRRCLDGRTPEGGASARRSDRETPMHSLAALLVVVIIAEHLALPLPTTDAKVPAIYRQIASEPGNFSVMQLPLGWRNSFGTLGSEQTQLQYYQTVHGKPIIGGNISRAPAFKMTYFARIPLFRALTDLELYREVSPEVDAAARAQAGALMALYDVRYLITFPPIPGRYPYQDTWQRTEAYALDVLPLEKPAFWEENGIRAYRVIQPSIAYPFRLSLGTEGTEPYLGEGWDLRSDEQPYGARANWIADTGAEVYLPLSGPTGTTLRIALAPLTYPGAPVQTVSVSVNGTTVLAQRELAPGWETLAIPVPAAATRRGPNRIQLSFAWAHSPRDVFPDAQGRAEIGSTGITSPVNLDVHSFSEAYISAFTADGTEIKTSAGRRGYNVAVFDPRDGRLLGSEGFDTAANAYESDRLAGYLASISPGQIVVLSTKGEAGIHLTPQAIDALRRLGSGVSSVVDLKGQAHALVGVQGAAAGSAAEHISRDDAFLRVAGDFRALAAAVQWVEFGP